jgi:hypothetical protein
MCEGHNSQHCPDERKTHLYTSFFILSQYLILCNHQPLRIHDFCNMAKNMCDWNTRTQDEQLRSNSGIANCNYGTNERVHITLYANHQIQRSSHGCELICIFFSIFVKLLRFHCELDCLLLSFPCLILDSVPHA